jgi:hypothetical protein
MQFDMGEIKVLKEAGQLILGEGQGKIVIMNWKDS